MASQALDVHVILQRWRRLSTRQRIVVGGIGALAVVWSVDAVLLGPLRRRLSRLQGHVRDTERRLLDAITASSQAEAVHRAFHAYESYAVASESAETELAKMLSEVESAIRQSGMTLLNLRPATDRNAPTETIQVSAEIEATPQQLVALLDRVQRSTRLLKVTELNVRVSESKTLRVSLVVSKLLLK